MIKLSDTINIIGNSLNFYEGAAIQQIQRTASLPHIIQAAGMPDMHPGRGYPVGATFESQDHIYPALIGNDIGCGMSFWKTNLPVHKAKVDRIDKNLGNLDYPLIDDDDIDSFHQGDEQNLSLLQSFLLQQVKERGIEAGSFVQSIGTIGGGNHFAELQHVDTIYNEALCKQWGLIKHSMYILVHSGSRGLGERILRKHVDHFSHNGLAQGTTEFDAYMKQHDNAIRFAELNREVIAKRILGNLNLKGQSLLDVNHNYLSQSDKDGWLHRKGTTPTDKPFLVIPGSRGAHTYIVKPKSSEDSLFSLAHGAGRKWIRNECKARLSHKYSPNQLQKTNLNSRVICNDKELIYEEAPQAYKDIDSVIQLMINDGLIELVARTKPFMTYKTRGKTQCC
ncbi:RNA ligase RtcB family protein [Vibrio sp.]|nr:RNA ligase RtcB family protein [Vibrio sp.]